MPGAKPDGQILVFPNIALVDLRRLRIGMSVLLGKISTLCFVLLLTQSAAAPRNVLYIM